ncbi:BatD family protein [Pokkaliibacter sp. CJK22405]|uniref:BatD family protein n=1 Tax=Pokkaliibacter sp. CJK22405 TaxID=3384615 RepID=UPI003984C74A
MAFKVSVLSASIMLLSGLANAEVTARLNSNQIHLNDPLTLTLTVSGAVVDQPPQLAPLNRDFEVLSSRANSVFRYVDNSMQKSTRWQIELKPRQSGMLSIPPLRVGNESTDPLQLEVAANPEVSFGNGNDGVHQEGGSYEDDASQPTTDPVTSDDSAQADSSDAQAKAKPVTPATPLATFDVDFSAPEPLYPGMPVKVIVHLAHQGSLLPAARIQPPVVSQGELFELKHPAAVMDETLDGRKLRKVSRNYLLFVDSPGDFTLDGFNFLGNIQPATGDAQTIDLTTSPHKLSLIKAPSEPFNPAFDLTLDGSWNKDLTGLKPGDVRIRTIEITAQGLPASRIALPPVPEIEGLDIRQSIIKPSNDITEDSVTGSVTVVQQFTFNKEGRFSLPEWNLGWWNRSTGAPDTAALPDQTLTVSLDASATTGNQASGNDNAPQGNNTATDPEVEAPPGLTGVTGSVVSTPLEENQPSKYPWLWPLISALGIIAALLLACRSWWLGRKVNRLEGYLEQMQQQKVERRQLAKESEVYEELALLCHANEPRLARLKIIEWGQCVWPGEGIATLNDIRQHARHQTLEYGLQDLEAAIIAQDEGQSYEWHSDLLLQMLTETRARVMRAKSDAMLQFNAL